MYKISYANLIDKKAVKKIGREERIGIQKAIEEKLRTRPEVFGKPLTRSLVGCRSLRVGDYRVIFRIEKDTIQILHIGHRSVAYKDFK